MGRRTVLLPIVLASACRAAAPEAPALPAVVVAWPQGAATLVPDEAHEEFTLAVQRNLFDTLIETDGAVLRPALAESWTTPDDRTWVFRLRRGVKLHDGRVLDASQVAACLQWAWTRKATASTLPTVIAVEAPDPGTVVVRTQAPFALLPVRLAGLSIWARPKQADKPPVGTGPFRVERFTPGADAVLARFDDHWRGAPAIARLEFRAVPDVDERLRLLRRGEVQLVPDVPAERLPELTAAPGIRTLSRRGLRVVFLGFDATRPPFRDLRVRRAARAALDLERLVADALGGEAEPIAQIVAPEVFGHDDTLTPQPPDPAEARRLKDAAGPGKHLELEYPSGKYRAIDAVARRVAADLGAAGLPVYPRAEPWEEWDARRERRELRLFLMGWMAVGEATASFEFLFHTPAGELGEENAFGYSNAELDRLVEAAPLATDPAQRLLLLRQAAQRVHDDVPVVPLYRQSDLYATAAGLVFEPRADRVILGRELRFE
jgi:peptide/nickel transport system substrate-binding protein